MKTENRADKTIRLYSVYLPPDNTFNFNTKDVQDVTDQLPSPFPLMGDSNGHHNLLGCEKVNSRGKQLEVLILKHYLILLNNKSSAYFHSVSGTFTSLDSPSIFMISPGKLVPTLVVEITFQLFWRIKKGSKMEVGEGKLGSISACHY